MVNLVVNTLMMIPLIYTGELYAVMQNLILWTQVSISSTDISFWWRPSELDMRRTIPTKLSLPSSFPVQSALSSVHFWKWSSTSCTHRRFDEFSWFLIDIFFFFMFIVPSSSTDCPEARNYHGNWRYFGFKHLVNKHFLPRVNSWPRGRTWPERRKWSAGKPILSTIIMGNLIW